MPIEEDMLEALEPIPQPIASVAVVMQMDLDITETATVKFGQLIEQIGPVTFFGKEERVLRMAAARIGELLCEPGKAFYPRSNASSLNVDAGIAMGRLEVVGDTEEDVDRSAGRPMVSPELGRQQSRQPEMGVSRKRQRHDRAA